MRRRARTALTVVAVLLAVIAASCTSTPVPQRSPVPAWDEPEPLSMQIVAHPDDDLLFMDPDLANWINAGLPTVTVYLTSGESDHGHSRAYAASRQRGTRAAYAEVAGVRDDWSVHRIRLGADRSAELYRLTERPSVSLVWLNLPDDNNPRAAGGKHALTRLWNDRSGEVAVTTLVPLSGAVTRPSRYTHEGLVSTLVTLFERFDPTVVRTQDGVPDARYQPQWPKHHDHPDHVMAARFTRQAAARYFAASPENRAVVTHYRDYNIADAPVNLAPRERGEKREHFAAYVPHDSEVSLGMPYAAWVQRSYYRWSRGTSWLVRDNGRLYAYAVVGHRLQVWTRGGDGTWAGPVEVGGDVPRLRPTLAVTATGEGVAVFARAAKPNATVVRTGSRDQWTDIGVPTGGDAAMSAQVGAPAAVTDSAGHAVVAVRDADGGVSMWRQGSGWTALGGSEVQGRPALVVDQQRRVHVFASTTDEVLHWVQGAPGASVRARPTPLPGVQPASQPVAERGADGEIVIAVRVADTGRIAVARSGERPVFLEAPGGFGTPELVSAPGRTVVFARNADGGVSTSALPAHGPPTRWRDLDGYVLDHPSATVEPDGSITLVGLGPGGRLLVNRQDDGAFQGWVPATAAP